MARPSRLVFKLCQSYHPLLPCFNFCKGARTTFALAFDWMIMRSSSFLCGLFEDLRLYNAAVPFHVNHGMLDASKSFFASILLED